MANKKKNKYPVQHKTYVGAKDHYVVKNGDYDGSGSSQEFAVYGHSTGSANSEMEEMSLQVTRDVGGVPDYRMDSALSWDEEDDLDDGPGFGDLGGPEFYGKKPTLLQADKKSPLYRAPVTAGHIGLWSALGLAGSAALAAIGFIILKNVSTGRKATTARSAARSTRELKSAENEGHSTRASVRQKRASRKRKTSTAHAE